MNRAHILHPFRLTLSDLAIFLVGMSVVAAIILTIGISA